MTLDPIILTNTICCFIILILGITCFVISRQTWLLFIGIAFGLFGSTHLLTLLDLKEALATTILATRIVAYMVVILTVVFLGCRRHKSGGSTGL